MTHTLEECELSTATLDECDQCGELTACVCLGAIVDEWEIEFTGAGGWMSFRYQYKEKGSLIARFGYASTYREAMDSIAHSVKCEGAHNG
jgi:hypothetical protein